MRAFSIISTLFALSSLALLSRPAQAQSTCSANSDCVKGWTCQVTGGSACASPGCPPGEKCDPQPTDCVPQEFKSCRPGSCRADSDCADGMVCYTHTESNCVPVACAPNQKCPEPDCTPKTESTCVPRYLLPCTTASDCGSGFQCESAGEQCDCGSGTPSSGSGASGGTAPTPETPNCTCEPSKELRCHAATVNCTADRDCSAGWTCATVTSGGCAGAPKSSSTPGAGAQGGESPAPDCTPPAEVKQCVPPYYGLIGGVRGVSEDSSGTPTLGTGQGGASSAPIRPATENGSANDATSSAGCSVSRDPRTGSALALFGALGLFGALRRRRARRAV